MKSLFLRVLAVLGTLLFAANTKAQTINFPIVVPLHFTQITGGDFKLGTYLSIGTGAAPALFELDTGATGFFATYSPNAGVSPWWGSDVTSLNTPVDASYASGLHYTGTLVEAAVTFFASSDPSSARLTTPILRVGQMGSIVDEKTNNTVIWNTNGSPSGDPPVNGAFYGDLGMGLTYNSSGIINLLAQLNYRRGVTPGFRIHEPADSNGLPPDRSHPQGYGRPFRNLSAYESRHRRRQQQDIYRTQIFCSADLHRHHPHHRSQEQSSP
jgi:hypothetical protein